MPPAKIYKEKLAISISLSINNPTTGSTLLSAPDQFGRWKCHKISSWNHFSIRTSSLSNGKLRSYIFQHSCPVHLIHQYIYYKNTFLYKIIFLKGVAGCIIKWCIRSPKLFPDGLMGWLVADNSYYWVAFYI